jgi:hypothetical protein
MRYAALIEIAGQIGLAVLIGVSVLSGLREEITRPGVSTG